MDRLRIGIAGMGRIGGVHWDAWSKTEGVEVVAAADPSPESRDRAAYATVENMLRDERLDIVSVCAPPSMHEAVTLAAARAGAAVLCEKPAAADTGSARRMLDGVAALGGKFQMATKFRHVPEIGAARAAITAGELGEIRSFRIEFAGVADMTRRWNSDPAVAGGGVIIDNGSHALDLAAYLFGPLAEVDAARRLQKQSIMVEDGADLTVITAGGVEGEIALSWSVPPSSQTYLTIEGTARTVVAGWKTYDKHAAHANMMASFRDFVLGHGPGWMTLDEVMGNQLAVEAAYRSLETGGAARLASGRE